MPVVFWVKDPTILFDKKYIFDIWPKPKMEMNEKLNAISKIIIVLTVLGFALTRSHRILVTGIITLAVLVLFYYLNNTDNQKKNNEKKILNGIIKEGFTNSNFYEKEKQHFTQPTSNNPLMNVLLPEINENPNRKSAAPSFNPAVENEINNVTKKRIETELEDNEIFNDLGDNLEFNQSMRQFYSTANSRVPNDQTAFAEFCYGDMISCKQGNEMACVRDNARYRNY